MAERLLERSSAPANADPPSQKKGERTRNRILDIAYESIIQKGFAATSVQELVDAAGITKSAFFYHFRDKNDLARQLLERFLDEDNAILDVLSERARMLSDEPLHSFLIFLNLYAEMMDDLQAHHPGCLVAAVAYQEQMFDADVRRVNAEGVLHWRGRFRTWFDEIAAVHPPRGSIDLDALADEVTVMLEGAIIFAKALDDCSLVGRQVRLFREMVKLIFSA